MDRGSLSTPPHAWARALAAIWALANALAGAWAAVELARSPVLAWPPLGQALLGVAGAIPMALYWGKHARAVARGRRRAARRLRAWFGGCVGAIVGALGTAFLVSGMANGMFRPLARDRLVAYDRLGRLMARAYPYFDEKEVDWPALLNRYRPAIKAAASDAAYADALGQLLLELNDAHTGVTTPWANIRCCFALTEEIQGQAVVTQPGGTAIDAGLVRGSIVRSVDGHPVEEALTTMHPFLRGGSTPWQRRYRAFAYLLSTSANANGLKVTFESPDGELRSAYLAWESASEGGGASHATGPIITGQRLSAGVGLIRIPTLSQRSGHDLVAEFDAALDDLMDAPALILDLRGNGGGDSRLGDRMVGRLLSEPVTYGAFEFAARLPQHGWLRRFPMRATPRRPRYDGPLAVLIDTRVMSSGEDLLAALLARGRVVTVGRRTAGASGNPISVRMPGGIRLRFSTGAGITYDGTLIEGRGFEPDIPVAWTIDDVRQGHDPDVAAAIAYLLGDTSVH